MRATTLLAAGAVLAIVALPALAAPVEHRSPHGFRISIPDGWQVTADAPIDPQALLGAAAVVERMFAPESTVGPAGRPTLILAFIPEEAPTGAPPRTKKIELKDVTEAPFRTRGWRTHATFSSGGQTLRYEAASLERPDGTAVAAFIVPDAEQARLASLVEKGFESLVDEGLGGAPLAPGSPASGGGGAPPASGSGVTIADILLSLAYLAAAVLSIAAIVLASRLIPSRWVGGDGRGRRPAGWRPAPVSDRPVAAAPRPVPVAPPQPTPEQIIVRSAPRTTFDRSLAGHGWAKMERELVESGLSPDAARAATQEARESLYWQERAIAARSVVGGAFALTLGIGASYLSFQAAQFGGPAIAFYGAVGWGLFEMFRGFRRWPSRPAPEK